MGRLVIITTNDVVFMIGLAHKLPQCQYLDLKQATMLLLPCLWLLNLKGALSFNINKVISNRNDQLYQVDFDTTSRKISKQVSYEPPKITTGADIDTSVAFALPLFSVQMPGYHEDPTLTNYVSQAALALTVFSLFVTAGAYFPFLFGLNGPSAIGRSEELSLLFFLSDCGEFAVCEAHSRPREFGWMALPFLIFIPGDNNGAKSESSWQRAANYGRSKIDCYDKYQCIMNPIWIVKYLLDVTLF